MTLTFYITKGEFMTLGKIVLIMAMLPMALLAQTSSTSDISEIVEDQGQQDKEEKVERIEVTGSLIKRVDVEGPKPIQTLDREALDRAGYNSVADVLRDLSANSFGSTRESSGSSIAGVGTVSLRGLGANRTLVLVNGRRVAKDGIGGVVDLNLIPMAAIERMDILKDSASATYGSDAVAGVVNIITKKDYDGVEFNMRHENAEFQGGNRTTVSGTFGKSTSKGNAMMTVQYRNNTKLFSKDRPWTAEGQSFNTPTPNINTGSGFRQDGNCPSGKIVNGACTFNFSDYSTETPAIEQINAFANGRYELSADTEIYAQANYTRKDIEWQYAPGVVQFTGSNRLKSDYIANKIGPDYDPSRGVDFYWRSLILGNRENETTETGMGAVVGMRRFIGDSWEVNGWVTSERIEREDTNPTGYAHANNLKRELESGANCDWLTPGGVCNLPDDVRVVPTETMTSELSTAELRASGEIFEMPGGMAAMAVGGQVTYETFSDELDELQQQGLVTGGGAGSTGAGDRTVQALYAEVNFPVIENLEVQVSGRYDKYNDFGDTFNPQAAIRYKPLQSVLLRASAGTGFKAPDMVDMYKNSSEGYPTFEDTKGCKTNPDLCGEQQWRATNNGNEGLKEEKSRSLSAGIVVEPNKNFNFNVDFFHVEMENVVGIDYQGLADADAEGRAGEFGVVFERDSEGRIENIQAKQLNLGQRKIAGYDFGFTLGGRTPVGYLGFTQNTTWLIRYDQNNFPGAALTNQLQLTGAPEWRNNIGFTYGPTQNLMLITNIVTTGSQYKADEEGGKLERYSQVDFQAAYSLRKLQARLTIGARNILGDTPPLDNTDINNQLNASLYNPIGRRFFADYTQSF